MNIRASYSIAIIIAIPIFIHFLGLLNILSSDPLQIYLNFGGEHSAILDGSPGWVDPNAGATTQALGHEAARQWLSGHIPWWERFSGMGLPLAAEMQNSALFFPFVLLLIFANGVLYLKIAMQIMSGLFMLGFLYEMRLSRLTALTGAILIELSGTLAWFAHGPIMPLPFLPLLAWGVWRSCQPDLKTRLGGCFITALAIAGSLYAGFPETAFMSGLLVLCIAIWRVCTLRGKWLQGALPIGVGGILGLFLSAPAVVPFLSLLRIGFLGQNTNYHDAHMLAANPAQTLFPYLFGPPLYALSAGGGSVAVDVWWHTGGYCDIALIFAGCAGLFMAFSRGTSFRGLRFVLGGYLLLSGLKAVGFIPVSRLIDVIPGIKQTMFYVYIAPGWWFALTLLSCMLLDDLNTSNQHSGRKSIKFALAGTLVGSVICLFKARPHIMDFYNHPGYKWYLGLSLLWATLVLTVLSVSLLGKRKHTVVAALVVNAAVLFFIPTLTGVRPAPADTDALSLLKQLTTQKRLVSFGVFPPNYGAFFGIPTINYNFLPLPERFAAQMDQHVCPHYDHTAFFSIGLGKFCSGDTEGLTYAGWQAPSVSFQDGLAWLQQHNTGVIMYPANLQFWHDRIGTRIPAQANSYQNLGGTPVSGVFSHPELAGATLRRVGTGLGTYNGAAKGVWHIKLCSKENCTIADGKLEYAADNLVTWLNLSTPLTIEANQTQLTYSIWSDAPAQPAAIALWPGEGGKPMPLLTLDLDLPRSFNTRQLLNNGHVVIEDLSGTTPYYHADNCVVTFKDYTHVHAECDKPGNLFRNEFYDEGWTAVVNGRPVQLVPAADQVQQSIRLGTGHFDIAYDYAPQHVRLIFILFTVGLVGSAVVGMMACKPRKTAAEA
ncbi:MULTISPECIES: hypothetical protein [Acetobacter]|uniref:YfhO family protein n=2 Tax=Acetobacter TaxID=434 RepID=A0AAN1PKH7_9PROT|nr:MULTISPECIES: hypothetical protein [Acetobacter]ASL39436.1 hypothetical protein CBI36_02550 [Acetobacter oryzifermentans]AXN01562.1 hypothetical protein CJF59_14115 [Acetobacter pomorum]KAA8394985.1 YfhO family protein [Acetobacter sp. DmW_125128]KAA8398719.1 YfhO family protein [Acetobacter sp. DmW_125127]KAA8399253.1 YfhO family protein [Acetobacter sp. DmW_125124]